MKKIVGTVFAIIVGFVAAHYSGLLTKFAIFEGQRASYTQEKLTADLYDAMPKTIGVLKDTFPAEYDQMIGAMMTSVKTGKNAEAIRLESTNIVATLRRDRAHHVGKAPDEMLKSLILHNTRLLEQVEAEEGTALCGAVANVGASAIPVGKMKTYYPVLDDAGAAMFRAIHAGMTAPIDHGQVSDEDWAGVLSMLQQSGLSAEDLNLIANVQSSDPRYCGLLIRFVKAVHAYEGAAGARVRSAFAVEIGAA